MNSPKMKKAIDQAFDELFAMTSEELSRHLAATDLDVVGTLMVESGALEGLLPPADNFNPPTLDLKVCFDGSSSLLPYGLGLSPGLYVQPLTAGRLQAYTGICTEMHGFDLRGNTGGVLLNALITYNDYANSGVIVAADNDVNYEIKEVCQCRLKAA